MTELELGPLRFGIIGAGRLGCTIGAALQRCGFELIHASSASVAGRELATRVLDVPVHEDPLLVSSQVDCVILCVPDDALDDVVRRLAQRSPDESPMRLRIVSTSADGGLARLAALAAQDHVVAIVHPVATVAGAESETSALTGAGAAIGAGDDVSRVFAHGLAHALEMHPFDLGETAWPLHAAACNVAANLTTTMLGLVDALAEEADIHDGVARSVYGSLAAHSVARYEALGAASALGGPMIRGDAVSIAAQVDAVRTSVPRYASLFQEALGVAATQAMHAGRLELDAGERIRRAVSGESAG